MLRDGVGVHLDVWKFRGVPLKMHFEIAFGREPATTNIALKGALTCVRSDMDL